MIITELWDYPPLPYLELVTQHCHKAAATYMALWKKRDKENCLIIKKSDIHEDYLMNVSSFNHNLRLLAKECVLNYEDHPKHIKIELVGWDEDAH